jgi:hypothetical protein
MKPAQMKAKKATHDRGQTVSVDAMARVTVLDGLRIALPCSLGLAHLIASETPTRMKEEGLKTVLHLLTDCRLAFQAICSALSRSKGKTFCLDYITCQILQRIV